MNTYAHITLLILSIALSVLMHELCHGVISLNHGCTNIEYKVGIGIDMWCEEYREREPWEEQQETLLQSLTEIIFYHTLAIIVLIAIFIQTYRDKTYI